MRESLKDLSLDGLWSKTPGSGDLGCPQCGAICGDSGMPACRFNCAPHSSEHRIDAPELGWLPTPTATANHCAPSMRKWPTYLRFQERFGTGGSPPPETFEWMMGLPIGWTDVE